MSMNIIEAKFKNTTQLVKNDIWDCRSENITSQDSHSSTSIDYMQDTLLILSSQQLLVLDKIFPCCQIFVG